MRTVLIYSGGLDSTVLLYHLKNERHEVYCVSFDYAQRHKKEIDSAHIICETAGVSHFIADISLMSRLFGVNALTEFSVPVPHGHYTDERMKQTIVPNRNMVMLSLGLSYAISIDCETVAYGAHRGDEAIYPDCREEFAEAMNNVAGLCDYKKRSVIYPFIQLSKVEIVRRGAELKVPFEHTWSCYKGKELHCGECGTCTQRREGFKLAGVSDPTRYEMVIK